MDFYKQAMLVWQQVMMQMHGADHWGKMDVTLRSGTCICIYIQSIILLECVIYGATERMLTT